MRLGIDVAARLRLLDEFLDRLAFGPDDGDLLVVVFDDLGLLQLQLLVVSLLFGDTVLVPFLLGLDRRSEYVPLLLELLVLL